MRIFNSALALGALLVAGPLMAQSAGNGFSVSADYIRGLDDLKKATNSITGFTLGAGYQNFIFNSEIPFRVSLNYQVLPGKSTDQDLKTSLKSVQVAGDIFVDTPVQHLRFVAGLSLQKYSVDNTGSIRDVDGALVKSFPVDTGKGIKFGARLGFEYRFNRSWSGEVLYQLTELGSTPTVVGAEADPAQGLGHGGINPAWVQLGARFHF